MKTRTRLSRPDRGVSRLEAGPSPSEPASTGAGRRKLAFGQYAMGLAYSERVSTSSEQHAPQIARLIWVSQ